MEEIRKSLLVLDGLKNKIVQIKLELSGEIFKKADEGAISKEVALDLLTVYDLLPIAPWIELPTFMDSYDYFDRYSTVKYMNYMDKSYFKDGEHGDYSYVPYSDITWEEGINELYEFVKEKQVIGCVYDW